MPGKLIALIAVVAAFVLLPFSAGTALAQHKRVALVIGNGAYQNVARLNNPLKDAAAVTEMFKKAGFDWVKMRQDLGNLEFKRALREFMDAANDAEVAVVYYAGHGIQVRDMNYMIPVDARLATEIDAEDEAVSLDRIVTALEPAKRLRLVILDACRDNPFSRIMKRRVATRAISGGLARMEPTLGDTLIAYAAKAGSVAEDGEGQNSPFAAALIKHLAVPGLDVRLAFGRVRDDVLKHTSNRQEPFVYGSLGGEAISLVPAPAQPKPAPVADVQRDFELIKQINTKRAWEIFVETHKSGLHVELARDEIKKLAMLEQPAPAKPRPSEPSSDERRAWDRVRTSDDRDKLREFIEKYPASPQAEIAKNRLDALDRAIAERAEKARLEREAMQRREEEARRLKAEEAQRQATEREAARKREEEARRLQLEAKQREDEARRQQAEEAQRKLAAEREAVRQREEEAKRLRQEAMKRDEEAKRFKAEEAERKLAAEREALRQREEDAKRLKAEDAQRKLAAEREAARQREEEARRLQQEAMQQAAQQAAQQQAALQAQQAQQAQQAKPSQDARKRDDESCARDDDRLARLRDSLSQGWAREDLKRLEQQTTCDRVRAQALALLTQPTSPITAPPAPAPALPPAPAKPAANTPELIRSAQSELRRLGCFAGEQDGKLGNSTTDALRRYLTQTGQPSGDLAITDGVVADLKDQSGRVCPLSCRTGEHSEGDRCVANAKPEQKPEKKATAARQREQDEERASNRAKREQAKREEQRREDRRREAARPSRPEREAARPRPERAAARPAPQPAARSQASAGPQRSGGSGSMIGVGF